VPPGGKSAELDPNKKNPFWSCQLHHLLGCNPTVDKGLFYLKAHMKSTNLKMKKKIKKTGGGNWE
jgi:hypothetical protein